MNSLVGWLGAAYMPLKALHLIVMVFWVAGLFILARYLVHQAADSLSDNDKWADRTARLRRIILTPALIVTWIVGLSLATSYGMAGAGWLHAKLLFVLLLSGYHGMMVALSRRMARGQRPLSHGRLRIWNEVPALLLIVIVGLAVLKPF